MNRRIDMRMGHRAEFEHRLVTVWFDELKLMQLFLFLLNRHFRKVVIITL